MSSPNHVIGYESFCAMVDHVVAECEDARWLDKATEFVQKEAQVRVPFRTGELYGSIQKSVEQGDNGKVGVVYTDCDHSVFVEFGTGPVGSAHHAGISPNVPAQWGDGPWTYMDDSGKFHTTNGQPAKPFMYPALADNRDEILRMANEAIEDAIKGA